MISSIGLTAVGLQAYFLFKDCPPILLLSKKKSQILQFQLQSLKEILYFSYSGINSNSNRSANKCWDIIIFTLIGQEFLV